ncbi:xin actin-binding repeat-containing protein 1-like [Stigmatopora nigra]
MQNNPFIAKNIEHSYAPMTKPQITPETEETVKVKNRTHMFESMPFDKIKQQNKDQVDTMVETLKESLTSLHQFNVIRADGTIIEVNETMRAKKAKYTLSESGATIKYDEVSEGNFQNFLLQLLPRANLRPEVTYLMEACNRSINSTLVNVPVHQHQFTGTQDPECNTVNVVQVVEDILNQDNSLRKGVIIQETDEKSADVVIYSLYKFSDEKDVRRYCTQDYLVETDERKSPSISADTPCQGSVNREETMKGNVKLFRSCIEKGDLEYLKTLQAKSTSEEQDGSLKQTMEQCTGIDPEQRRGLDDEGPPELVPVDVKSLRNMFSEDPRQSQSNFGSMTISNSPIGPNVTFENIQSSTMNDNDVSSKIPDPEKHNSKSVESTEKPEISAPNTNSQLKQKEDNTSPQKSKKSEEHDWSTNSASDIQNERNCLNQNVSKEKNTAKSPVNLNSTEDVPLQQFQATVVSPHGSETQQEEEVDFQGKLKAAMDSLERSHINVTRGDFKAAMIYRNASRPPKERPKTAGEVSSDNAINPENCITGSPTQPRLDVAEEKTTANATSIITATQKNLRPIGPKPTIPPKPEHLKVKQQRKEQTNAEKDSNITDTNKVTQNVSNIKTVKDGERDVEGRRKLSNEQIAVERSDIDQQQVEIKSLDNVSQDILIIKKKCEEDQRECNETRKTLGGTNDLSKMRPPMKPKRVKISQTDYKMSNISTQVGSEPQSPLVSNQREEKDDKHGQGNKEEGKVELRAKRGRMETEDERRQRLSVHMDEIMRGNIGAAMEIFDNLRKQEELRVILSRVEEIEQDTSKVDVRSLRNTFEEVPDWVVSPNKKKPKQEKKTERKQETTPLSASQNKSSMAHIFGDLERASEEIITLKEQTLARLVDIEEAIKKALYSVSSLKSESDIAGLSSLFQESLGSVQESSVPGNISKISIESSKTKSLHVTEGTTAPSSGQNTYTTITPRPREGLPCSPAFISIESIAKKSDKTEPMPQEDTICLTYQHSPQKYCSTKTVECNSPALNRKKPNGSYPQREISVLEVQTDTGGSRISGAKTVKENYERLDALGNRIYSSTTSTFVTTQPETTMASTEMMVTRPFLHHVTTYPELLLPVKPNP